jgi:hypothetical protein
LIGACGRTSKQSKPYDREGAMITRRRLLKAAGIGTLISRRPRSPAAVCSGSGGRGPAQPFADTARGHAHGSDPGHIAGQEAAHSNCPIGCRTTKRQLNISAPTAAPTTPFSCATTSPIFRRSTPEPGSWPSQEQLRNVTTAGRRLAAALYLARQCVTPCRA